MSDFIPLELITQILKRVPPKSLVRFRCVSKSWNALISSPDFVSMHTHHAFQSDTVVPRILVRCYSQAQKAELYSVHHDNEAFTVDEDVKMVIPRLSSRLWGYFRVVGSSNGLVFLSDDFFGHGERFVLLNPSLRRKFTLPMPRAIFDNVGPYESIVGYGYDAKNNDFKVVKLTYLQREYVDQLPPIVEVFSLSTRNWREINGNSVQNYVIGHGYVLGGHGCNHAFLNGKVHWIACQCGADGLVNRSLIQVFDISDEVFEEMPLPYALVSEKPKRIGIVVYEKSLVVFHYGNQHDPRISSDCCFWVMEEYGVGKSWTKLFNVHDERVSRRVLGFRKNGSIMLAMRTGELISYDPRTKRTTQLGVFGSSEGPGHDLSAVTYTESLALHNEGEQALAELPNEREPLLIESDGSDSVDEETEEENN